MDEVLIDLDNATAFDDICDPWQAEECYQNYRK